jgi:hypothetical protein
VVLFLCGAGGIASAVKKHQGNASTSADKNQPGALTPVPDSAYPYGNNPTKITTAQFIHIPSVQQRAMSRYLLTSSQMATTAGNIQALTQAVIASGYDYSETRYGVPANQYVGGWALELISVCGGTTIPGVRSYAYYGGTCPSTNNSGNTGNSGTTGTTSNSDNSGNTGNTGNSVTFQPTTVRADCTSQALVQASAYRGSNPSEAFTYSDAQVPDSEFMCVGRYAEATLYSPSFVGSGGHCAVGYFRDDSGFWSAYMTGDISVPAADLGMPQSIKDELDSTGAKPTPQCNL